MKRIVSILITAILLITSIPLVSATDYEGVFISKDGLYKYKKYSQVEMVYDDETETFLYESRHSCVYVVKYIGKDNLPKNFYIPNYIDGYRVKSICRGAFYNLSSLVNIISDGYESGYEYIDEGCQYLETKAFYNCTNLKKLTVKSNILLDNKAVGYKKEKLNKGFKVVFRDNTVGASQKYYYDNTLEYAHNNKCKAIFNTSSENSDFGQEKIPAAQTYKSPIYGALGGEFYLKVDGKTVKGWKSSNPKAIKITKDGKAAILKKGTATLEVTVNKNKICRTFVVQTNPYFKKSSAKFSEIIDSISVKKGKTASVYLFGKVNSINNVYTNTTKAKFISSKSAKTLKIKGLKRGTTTLKVKVNGVKTLKLKVKVK